jgi:hypothetical protein
MQREAMIMHRVYLIGCLVTMVSFVGLLDAATPAMHDEERRAVARLQDDVRQLSAEVRLLRQQLDQVSRQLAALTGQAPVGETDDAVDAMDLGVVLAVEQVIADQQALQARAPRGLPSSGRPSDYVGQSSGAMPIPPAYRPSSSAPRGVPDPSIYVPAPATGGSGYLGPSGYAVGTRVPDLYPHPSGYVRHPHVWHGRCHTIDRNRSGWWRYGSPGIHRRGYWLRYRDHDRFRLTIRIDGR